VSITYAELYDKVARLARSLREMGIQPATASPVMPTMIETVIGMLAATSIGASVLPARPDFGNQRRPGSIRPDLSRACSLPPMVTATAAKNSIRWARSPKVVKRSEHRKGHRRPLHRDSPDPSRVPNGVLLDDFMSKEKGLDIAFEQLPANHPPLYHVLVGHHRSSQVHRSRGGGHPAAAHQGAQAAHGPQA